MVWGLNRRDPPEPSDEIYTISRLNREARELLESGFPMLWVRGEVSNLARPSSGHLYFTLKDAQAQVRCALFRSRVGPGAFQPENGIEVLALARVTLYETRGEFQLVVEQLEPAGDGALRQAFEVLKRKLALEGLFAQERKRSLPPLPRRIGVISSPSGAALRDILSVHRRRFPAIPLLLYPVPVQGEGAAAQIARALRVASERQDCDVLLLARGGGSLEDLWAFNEEVVARAIFDCRIPVVTGIGHEVDFTIADLVADLRAPTPSAAAELVTPDRNEWIARCARLEQALLRHWQDRLGRERQRLDWLRHRFERLHPARRMREQAQRLDELETRLARAVRVELRHGSARLATFSARLYNRTPLVSIAQRGGWLDAMQRRMGAAMEQRLVARRLRLESLGRALDAVSPLATLARGFAIVTRERDGQILRDAEQVAAGERVRARLARGELCCRVEERETG